MGDISTKRALVVPATLAGVMIAIAAAISFFWTGVSGGHVFWPYLGAWGAITLLSVLIWVFVQIALLFLTGASNPLSKVFRGLRRPLYNAPLPAIIFPLFLGGYTWAKSSIPIAVGYGWETAWSDLDRMLLGTDAWQWSHRLMPDIFAPAWTFYYAVVWGFALAFSGALISSFATRHFAATYFTGLMLTWLIGGIGLAYCMSAAGPVFAHIADPTLVGRFDSLHAELARLLASNDWVLSSQRYLESNMGSKVAIKGGGVSAMPSMHIGTATVMTFAAWRTKWLPAALLFWALTFFGSMYLGYHYMVDAPVAVGVAAACWIVAQRIFEVKAARGNE